MDGVLSYLLGGFDKILGVLIAFSIFDYITGVMSAIYHKQLSSYKGYQGIAKKLGIFILVAIATLLETGVGIPTIREIVIMFFIANEGISITENLIEIGLPLPPSLKRVLAEIVTKYEDEKVNSLKENIKQDVKNDINENLKEDIKEEIRKDLKEK